MRTVRHVSFLASGHENVIGDHKTTLELTSETFLTRQGTCIMGVRSELVLHALEDDIKSLARSKSTEIRLTLSIDGRKEEIIGHGSPGLTYADRTSMVVRTSSFECPRTLMVRADKAASDLDREFVERLKSPEQRIACEILFTAL